MRIWSFFYFNNYSANNLQNLVVYKIIINFAVMRKHRPLKHVEVGPYELDFYFKSDSPKRTYLEIKCGKVVAIRIDGRTHAYAYLLAAAEQGYNEQLHGYAAMLYSLATSLTKDQELVNDVVSALNAYSQRKEDKGAEQAAAVTEAQETAVTEAQETADQVLMESIVAEASMSDKAREAAREAFKESIKDVIEEKEDGI